MMLAKAYARLLRYNCQVLRCACGCVWQGPAALMFSSPSSESKVTRSGRAECYKARDAFYQCMKEGGVLYSSKTPIPSKCKHLRSRFESSCLSSWVQHFDELQEQKAREIKQQYATINSKAANLAGNLAGKGQD